MPVWLRSRSAARIPLSANEPVPRSTGEKLARAKLPPGSPIVLIMPLNACSITS
ncbi:hypothetical protein D3C72_1947790 [compost metagenome]